RTCHPAFLQNRLLAKTSLRQSINRFRILHGRLDSRAPDPEYACYSFGAFAFLQRCTARSRNASKVA
ncbi:MAG: hypothetical protein L0Z50_36330, partial [Verrucomicrobiales bacterium]|nr:hypothetical protein [Verrucomicrobiales bacterium]